LLFLEPRRGDSSTESFALRIARQTQNIVTEKPLPSAFRATRPALHFLVFIMLLSATVVLSQTFAPWKRLKSFERRSNAAQAQPDQPLDLPLPATNNGEQNRPWR